MLCFIGSCPGSLSRVVSSFLCPRCVVCCFALVLGARVRSPCLLRSSRALHSSAVRLAGVKFCECPFSSRFCPKFLSIFRSLVSPYVCGVCCACIPFDDISARALCRVESSVSVFSVLFRFMLFSMWFSGSVDGLIPWFTCLFKPLVVLALCSVPVLVFLNQFSNSFFFLVLDLPLRVLNVSLGL